jgi:glutamine amidotransferase/cyclase
MQVLFGSSEESPGCEGLGILSSADINGSMTVQSFKSQRKSVPHMGWNRVALMRKESSDGWLSPTDHYYFVHSFAVKIETPIAPGWVYSLTRYQDEVFVSAVQLGPLFATQFHPEKSGKAGLYVLHRFLALVNDRRLIPSSLTSDETSNLCRVTLTDIADHLTPRIVACLDVRANDDGELVVTKGDQYAVREKDGGQVRNLGNPVQLAREYYEQGADEIALLNITSFRNCPLMDLPMIDLLEQASREIFVPLTIGGGIRDCPAVGDIPAYSALDIADAYFRSGADKISIGSEAVYAAERYWNSGGLADGKSAIEKISKKYGRQAVVVSVDPRRVYVSQRAEGPSQHTIIKSSSIGPHAEEYCWFQCTVKGGREGRDIDVVALVKACEALGAGEILLNSMDQDGYV